MAKKTDWIDCNHKPLRKGVYEALYAPEAQVVDLEWDGQHWRWGRDRALANQFGTAVGDSWRGLTKPSSK